MKKQARARTPTKDIKADLILDLQKIRAKIDLDDPETAEAWAGIETFCAISIRIIAQTNPSKVRSCAVTTEIGCLMRPDFKAE